MRLSVGEGLYYELGWEQKTKCRKGYKEKKKKEERLILCHFILCSSKNKLKKKIIEGGTKSYFRLNNYRSYFGKRKKKKGVKAKIVKFDLYSGLRNHSRDRKSESKVKGNYARVSYSMKFRTFVLSFPFFLFNQGTPWTHYNLCKRPIDYR